MIPAVGVVQQTQPVQLGTVQSGAAVVLNALNALPGQLVLPGMGGVVATMDGHLPQNATTVQIPQLTVSNVVHQVSPRFASSFAALISVLYTIPLAYISYLLCFTLD